MSRFTGPNKDYEARATLCVSMRSQDEGGDVVDPCKLHWKNGQALTQMDLVVLVHGFNNHLEEAQTAYLGFRKRQAAFLAESDGDRLETMLSDVFWPGDADWGFFDFLDFFCYPASIKKAVATAPVLADYLMSRTDVHNLYFIGHSMGCRVILETIKLLLARGHATPIRKVCLMAAAVPTYMVYPPDGSLKEALQAPDHVRILYSPADEVLAGAFPAGETAGGDGFFPAAIGRHGDVPLTPGKVDRDWIPNAGHSDYWGWKESVPSGVAAKAISNFLAIGSQARSLRESAPPPERAAPPERPQRERRIGHP